MKRKKINSDCLVITRQSRDTGLVGETADILPYCFTKTKKSTGKTDRVMTKADSRPPLSDFFEKVSFKILQKGKRPSGIPRNSRGRLGFALRDSLLCKDADVFFKKAKDFRLQRVFRKSFIFPFHRKGDSKGENHGVKHFATAKCNRFSPW